MKIVFKKENNHIKKLKYGLSCNNYRVATLPKLYLTVKGIIMPSLKSLGQFNIPKLTIKGILYRQPQNVDLLFK